MSKKYKKSNLYFFFFIASNRKIYFFLNHILYFISIKEYNEKWSERDIFKNFSQKHEVDYAKEKVRPEVENEVTIISYFIIGNIKD